jgi:molybdenum cofactor biosynthesis enzyme MoaA
VNVVLLRGRERRRDPGLSPPSPATPGASCASSSSCRWTARGSGTATNSCPAARSSNASPQVWPLVVGDDQVGPAPAERFRFVDGAGEIGLISSVTQPFCATCNRLRLTADGAIRNCLFSDDELTVRDALREGHDDEVIARLLRQSVWAKFPGHAINEPDFLRPARSMSMIGG